MEFRNKISAKAYAFLVLISLFVIGACSTSTSHVSLDNKKLETEYNKSIDIWNKAKAENGGNYEFALTNASFVGWASKTVITVRDNKVVGRKYYDNEANKNQGMVSLVFEETGNEVNSNEKGERAITMDQVYENCGKYVLVKDEEMNTISFKVDDSGILQLCGFCEAMVMDDCFTGDSIQGFKWL